MHTLKRSQRNNVDLFIAIALLCQHNSMIKKEQLTCQQSYVHCVNLKSISISKEEALNKCIMEKK